MAFSEETIDAVWRKGTVVPDYDSNTWRKDACGALMRRSDHGNRNSSYGWEIDHIDPNAGDYLWNLQPLQWENNAAKSDGELKCVVRS